MTTHVILDLDQTIISAETPKEIDLNGNIKQINSDNKSNCSKPNSGNDH